MKRIVLGLCVLLCGCSQGMTPQEQSDAVKKCHSLGLSVGVNYALNSAGDNVIENIHCYAKEG